MATVKWSEAMWRGALRVTAKRWLPRFNGGPCGFCEETGHGRECGRGPCREDCVAYTVCWSYFVGADRGKAELVRLWLRLKGREHGVKMPKEGK